MSIHDYDEASKVINAVGGEMRVTIEQPPIYSMGSKIPLKVFPATATLELKIPADLLDFVFKAVIEGLAVKKEDPFVDAVLEKKKVFEGSIVEELDKKGLSEI
jgi:hypothetical protein